jgi:hypothetical protein
MHRLWVQSHRTAKGERERERGREGEREGERERGRERERERNIFMEIIDGTVSTELYSG